MIRKNYLLLYFAPKCEYYEAHWTDLLCDSYGSGIDDIDYEDVDWTVNL